MKILVITERLRPEAANGSEVFSKDLCRILARRHELTAVVRHGDPPAAELGPTRVIPVVDQVAEDPERSAAFLRTELELDGFDLIYNLGGLNFGSNLTYALGLIGCAVPLVNHFQALLGPYAHHEGLDEPLQRASGAGQKTVSKRAVMNIFTSLSELRRSFKESFGTPDSVALAIPNGVCREELRGIEPEDSFLPEDRRSPDRRPFVVATAGRFSDYVKGADLVYRAFAELARDRRDVFLLSIGNARRFGDILGELPADTYRLRDWLPRRRFLAEVAAADVMVVPSRYEPFGLIAVEAMMLGLPVVANAVGGLREIVAHRRTGLLSNVEDGSLGLCLALSELLADRDGARAMGRAGRRRAEIAYDIEHVGRQVDQALQLAVVEARSRPVRSLLADYAFER